MLTALPTERQRKLLAAIAQLNLAGMHSAYEIAGNPDLQGMSAARIKEKIAGMTADEIVDYAARSYKPGDPKAQ